MLSRKLLAALVTVTMVVVPMVASTALTMALLQWAGGQAPWGWLRTAFLLPVGYLAWLFGFLAISAGLCQVFCRRWPKPRRLVFGPGVVMESADVLRLMTIGIAYQGFAIVHSLPLARVFGPLLLRAYSSSSHIGQRTRIWGFLYDPDLIHLGDRVLIGGRALIVAHSVTVRQDGASVYVSAPVTVGNRSTIGGDSLISLGCSIGEDAIIETGAVLAPFTQVPSGEVWGGNPAVRRRSRDEPAQTSVAPEQPETAPPAQNDVAQPTDVAALLADARRLVIDALALDDVHAVGDLSHDGCAAWDSLGQVAIAAAIHGRYQIAVAPADVFRLRTVADVAGVIGGRTRDVLQPVATLEPQRPDSGAWSPSGDPELLPLLDAAEATRMLASRPSDWAGGREPLSVLVVSSFTTQSIAPTLVLWARAFGLDVDCQFAGYDQVVQTLLAGQRPSDPDRRHVTIVLTRPEDLAADSQELSTARVDQLIDAIRHAAAGLRGKGRLLVGTLPPAVSSFALQDKADVEAMRHRVRAAIDAMPGVETFDFGEVVESLGIDRSRSNQSEVFTRGPYSPDLYLRLAIALVRRLRSPLRSPAKVVAVDCDHTLWGGVVGEVGVDGLEIGSDGNGRSFQLFQRYLKGLKDRGVLLVVVSKNEDRDVREVFTRHPGMILRPDDIAAWRVNWRHKSENLRELAEELNLGLDAFVFLDDDPTVRLEVETRVPAVHVVPLPADPAGYCDTLSRLWLFDGVQATDVDGARTRMAVDEQLRREERASAATLDDFLESLELRAEVGVAADRHWPRVAQLTQRTNQFNLSLKRRTTEEIQALADDRTVLMVEAADRFGDYGLVGVCILEPPSSEGGSEIDTLLMSCRALGRGVEDAFLHAIAAGAVENGTTELVAPYVEGPRNAQVRDFLRRTGFAETQPNRWTRSLMDPPLSPPHVRLHRAGRGRPKAPATMAAILDRRRESHPLAVLAYETLLEQLPSLNRSLPGLVGPQDDVFWADAETRCHEVLHLCDGDTARLRHAVSAWVEFSMEYLTKQSNFLKTGKYAATSFDEVRQELYDDDERMRNFYLVALLFSFLFSANYVGYFRFFRDHLLPRLHEARTVCDIGCGHGVYLSQMLMNAPAASGTGLDISDASLATTRSLLQYHGLSGRQCVLTRADLRGTLPVDSGSQDAATCFEVLEHLDDPLHALEEIRRILRPGGSLCVSAAVRMESVDHLYVFNQPGDVAALLTAAGFRVVIDDAYPLTVTDSGDPAAMQAAIDDPRVSLGYVALALAE